jgi:HemX protein
MDRSALLASTVCFMAGFVLSVQNLRARVYRPSRWSFFAALGGFLLQMVWLSQRGKELGRCPLSSLFDVLVFLGWSVALLYLLTGATYRMSLLGVFSSPLVFLLQLVALLLPVPLVPQAAGPVNFWLELHAAVSVVAYGAFALAGIAGLTLLVQERQLKTRKLHSFFYHFPPIHDLAAANRRLVYIGFALLTVGLFAGLRQGMAHIGVLRVVSFALWLLYGFLCLALGSQRISPRRAAWLASGAFLVLLLTVWAVQLVSKG